MTELDQLFAEIGWDRARQDGDTVHYFSREAVEGFQPKVRLIKDASYTLEEIVSLIAYYAYLDGLEKGKDLAADLIRELH